MTDKELAEIKRVWAAATPGPWAFEDGNLRDATRRCVVGAQFGYDVEADSEETAAAIAKAPEHVAALLAEVERLRARLAQVEAERDELAADSYGANG